MTEADRLRHEYAGLEHLLYALSLDEATAAAEAMAGAMACPLLPHLPHIVYRVHQRQPLSALVTVSYMGVQDLGFLVGYVVLDPGEEGGPGGAEEC